MQFKALQDSIEGQTDLYQLPSQQVSFTVPAHEELLAALIEAIFESHPYEQPVILVQPVWSTRFKYTAGRHNPNKWWHRGRGEVRPERSLRRRSILSVVEGRWAERSLRS